VAFLLKAVMMVVISPPSVQEPHAGLYLSVELESYTGILE